MSINVNAMVGEAIVQACERAGFVLWADEGSAQVRIRDKMAQPADDSKEELARAATHTPRALPHQLSADLNNKRGSVLMAIRARAAAARAADGLQVALPVPTPADPPKGIINQPGFGDNNPPEDPVKVDLSDQVTKVLDDTAPPVMPIDEAAEPLPDNPSLDPTVDPLLSEAGV